MTYPSPDYIYISEVAGLSVRVYWPELAEQASNDLKQKVRETFDVGADGVTYRTWRLTAYRTHLMNDGAHNIYLRLTTGGEALLVFAVESGNEKPLIEESEYDVRYVWIKIGHISAKTGTQARIIDWLDYGYLGTEVEALRKQEESTKWYDTNDANAAQKLVIMLQNWYFQQVESIRLRFMGADDYIDGIADDAQIADIVEPQHKVPTVRWLINTFLGHIRPMFVRRDTTDTQTMKATLHTDIDLVADGGVTAATVDAGRVTATADVTAGQTITTAGADIGETIGDHGVYAYKDANAMGHVVTDFMAVRRAAWFREVTIEEVKHVGGELILSQAACTLSKVERRGGLIRCYFERSANGKTSYNEWRIGDQAYCQAFNIAEGTSTNQRTKYYWRLVEATGTEGEFYYIDFADTADPQKTATGSDLPEANDSVVLLGSRTGDGSRTTAQILSTAGSDAPSRKAYYGITSFSLTGCAVEVLNWERGGAHWRLGGGDKYMEFRGTQSDSSLVIHADEVHIGSRSVGDTIGDIQSALDDGLEIHVQQVGDAADTMDAFKTEDHIGMYYLTSPEGLVYQLWAVDDGTATTLEWRLVEDKYLLDVMAKLQEVQDHYDFILDLNQKICTMGNTHWRWDGKDFVEEQGAIITTANSATLLADYARTDTVTGQIDTVRAEISATVADGISRAVISASQIDLTGDTTVTGMLRRGQMVITSQNIGQLRTGTGAASLYCGAGNILIPLNKLANYTYFVSGSTIGGTQYDAICADGENIDIVLPCEPFPPIMYTYTEIASRHAAADEDYASWMNALFALRYTGTGNWWDDDAYIENIRRTRGHTVADARRYVGTAVDVYATQSVPLRFYGVKAIELYDDARGNKTVTGWYPELTGVWSDKGLYGTNDYSTHSDPWHWSITPTRAYAYTGGITHYHLECVYDLFGGPNGTPQIYWKMTITIDVQADAYVMGLA